MKNIIRICFSFILLFMLCASTAFASVEDHEASAMSYTMHYPIVYVKDNLTAQNKINKSIYKYIADFQNAYNAGKFYQGSFSYKVQYEDDKCISLTISDYRYNQGAAHGLIYTFGLNYNKSTGEEIPLYNFVKIRPEDGYVIFGQPIYNSGWKRLYPENRFLTRTISDNYYMMGNGYLALIYQTYSIGSGADGTCYIVLSPEIIDYLNRRNQ